MTVACLNLSTQSCCKGAECLGFEHWTNRQNAILTNVLTVCKNTTYFSVKENIVRKTAYDRK